MNRIFGKFGLRSLKFSKIGLAAITATFLLSDKQKRLVKFEQISEQNLQNQNANDPVEILKTLLLSQDDILLVMDIDILADTYKTKTEELLSLLSKTYPNLKILKVTKDQLLAASPELEPMITEDTFVISRSQISPQFELFDHYTFLMKTKNVINYYAELDSISMPEYRKLNKFSTIVAACEANSASTPFLKKLSQTEEYDTLNVVNFKSCETFGATPSDLILLKKHSKYNSYGDKYKTVIDGNEYDIVKMENYFAEKVPDPDKDINFAKALSSFSVFAPNGVPSHLDAKYTFVLSMDLNKIGDSERKEVLKTTHKIASIFAEKNKDDVLFVYKPTDLKKQKFSITLLDNQAHSLRLFYLNQNKNKASVQKLISKFPFLTEQKSNTYAFKFDLQSNDYNLENFKKFFDGVKDGTTECHRESAEPAVYKCSKKLVRNNFPKIFKDGKDHIVFFHSTHCQMCKKVSKAFESMAVQNLLDGDAGLEYNRVNVNKNTFYSHSPVLAYFKSGQTEPILYQSDYFTESSLEGFINALRAISFEATYPQLDSDN